MRHENTHEKFRRWPPRVKRRRPAPAERPGPDGGGPAAEPPTEPAPEPPPRTRPTAGRDVKVSFRHRRRPLTPAGG